MDLETRRRVKQRVRDKMESIIERRIQELPEDMQNIYETNPFGSRLVPNEIWKGSKFERSFVTSFGQGVYEQIALEIAIGSGAFAENQHIEQVALNTWQEESIQGLLARQRSASRQEHPDWNHELATIAALSNPRHIELDTRFDLYVRRENGAEEYYSIKTVKPNLDQVEIAKRDMLRISTAKPACRTYFGLPYNPDGEGNHYSWTIPKKLFDMNTSPAVLIGANFWNAVGASNTTFVELLELFREVGVESREKITNDFLRI